MGKVRKTTEWQNMNTSSNKGSIRLWIYLYWIENKHMLMWMEIVTHNNFREVQVCWLNISEYPNPEGFYFIIKKVSEISTLLILLSRVFETYASYNQPYT